MRHAPKHSFLSGTIISAWFAWFVWFVWWFLIYYLLHVPEHRRPETRDRIPSRDGIESFIQAAALVKSFVDVVEAFTAVTVQPGIEPAERISALRKPVVIKHRDYRRKNGRRGACTADRFVLTFKFVEEIISLGCDVGDGAAASVVTAFMHAAELLEETFHAFLLVGRDLKVVREAAAGELRRLLRIKGRRSADGGHVRTGWRKERDELDGTVLGHAVPFANAVVATREEDADATRAQLCEEVAQLDCIFLRTVLLVDGERRAYRQGDAIQLEEVSEPGLEGVALAIGPSTSAVEGVRGRIRQALSVLHIESASAPSEPKSGRYSSMNSFSHCRKSGSTWTGPSRLVESPNFFLDALPEGLRVLCHCFGEESKVVVGATFRTWSCNSTGSE